MWYLLKVKASRSLKDVSVLNSVDACTGAILLLSSFSNHTLNGVVKPSRLDLALVNYLG